MPFEVNDQTGGYDNPEWTNGLYTMKTKDVEQDTRDDGSIYYIWRFEVLSPKRFRGEEFVDFSQQKFGPRAKSRIWVEAALNRALEEGEVINEADLVDKVVACQVGDKKDLEGKLTGNKGILFMSPQDEEEGDKEPVVVGAKKGKKKTTHEDEEINDDLDSIPF